MKRKQRYGRKKKRRNDVYITEAQFVSVSNVVSKIDFPGACTDRVQQEDEPRWRRPGCDLERHLTIPSSL